VLVWEFPRIILAERSESNPLTAVMLRQIMPLLAKAPKLEQRVSVPLQTRSVVDFSATKPATKTDFIRVQFDSFQTRDFKLKLIFDSGSEEIEMVRSHGTHLDSFVLELPGSKVLKQVIVEALEAPQGNVSVESFKY
jgi:hypothetical protein